MATTEEIRAGLAELVNEVTGIDADDVQLDKSFTEDLDVFVPHQANMRIVDAMARALKLPPHVAIARDIAYQGNTSAASIPLALNAMVESGEAKPGDTALLIAFGAGLSYAAQVVGIPPVNRG